MLINDCGWKDGDSGYSAAKNLLTQTGLLMEGDNASVRFCFVHKSRSMSDIDFSPVESPVR